MRKVALLAAAGAMAIAIPATAKPTPGTHPSHPSHPAKSHKCKAHKIAFVASGTLGTWSLTKDSNGKTYSGMLTVTVKHANHSAGGYKTLATTFTVAGAHVTFGHGVATQPAPGSRVKLIGKITALAKKCDKTGFTPVVTIRKIVVHTAKA
jgi:hypothetical protein